MSQGDATTTRQLLGSQESSELDYRALVDAAEFGEPALAGQPSPEFLTDCILARKRSAFPKFKAMAVTEASKFHDRPLAGLLTLGIKKLWALLINDHLSPADALNLLMHCGQVAADTRNSPQSAALAAVMFFHERLAEAFEAYRSADSRNNGLSRVAAVLHNPAGETKSEVLRVCEKEGGSKQRGAKDVFCTNFAFATCDDKERPRIHGCPFCGKVTDNVAKCMDAHTQGYNIRVVSKEKLQQSSPSKNQFTGKFGKGGGTYGGKGAKNNPWYPPTPPPPAAPTASGAAGQASPY